MATRDRRWTGTWLKVILAAAVVAAGLSLAVPAVLSAPSAGAPSLPVMYGSGGWQHGLVRPHAVYFGAGGSLFIRTLTWSRWTAASAYGRGVRWADDCVPNCAAGTYHRSPASLTLWRVRWHSHQRYFSRMTLRWTTPGGTQHRRVYRWGNPYGGTVPLWY